MMTADLIRDVLDGLDLEHAYTVADQARGRLALYEATASPPFEVCYQPGDGTLYSLLIAPLGRLVVLGAAGGGTGDREPHSGLGGTRVDRTRMMLVYYVQPGRGFVMGRTEFLTPEYVGLRTGAGAASALALAVLLNRITGQPDDWTARMIATAEERAL